MMRSSKKSIKQLIGVVMFSLITAALSSGCAESNEADRVSLEQARAEFESGKAVLVDVRESSEHKTGVADGAVLLPMSELTKQPNLLPKNADKPVLLICNTQNRSKATLQLLKQQGYQNIRYVEGGMSQWSAQGWPLVSPK
jgi:rhodanese-related sulfurtransferase